MTDREETPAFSDWWATPARELARQTGTPLDQGLSGEQVEEHRRQYGSNQLEDTGPMNLWKLAWESARSPMIILLLTIAGISLLLGQIGEAIVMAFVVATYVGIHLLNKARADRTMARLREVQAPTVRVLREGQVQEGRARDIAAGFAVGLQAIARGAAAGSLL